MIPTGGSALDQLLNKYNFDTANASTIYPTFPMITIYTSDSYNLIPVLKEFSDLASISDADFDTGCIGDGNTITLERMDESATITFSIGSGDCPSGCLYRTHWEFSVSNGVATFIRTY